MTRDAAREHDERGDQHPFRPEVAVRPAEEPDEDGDRVHDRVLERERAPARVAWAHRREPGGRQLPKRVVELTLRARRMKLVQSLLELVERQATRLVVPAQIVRNALTLGIGNEDDRDLSQDRIVENLRAPRARDPGRRPGLLPSFFPGRGRFAESPRRSVGLRT
jgi:hypothetical protein